MGGHSISARLSSSWAKFLELEPHHSRLTNYSKMLKTTAEEKVVVPELGLDEKTSSDGDSQVIEWDEKDEARIRRRMDLRIVPTVFALYLMCFIDR